MIYRKALMNVIIQHIMGNYADENPSETKRQEDEVRQRMYSEI